MIIKSKPISRRTLLRGLGVGIALPLLDIMMPTESYAMDHSYTGFVYVPNGWYIRPNQFFPDQSGSNYTMPQLLAPLSAHRDDFSIISNLFNQGGRPNGDGPGDHARAGGSYLSSVKLLKDSAQVNGGQTIDRHISNATRSTTPIDQLLMGYGANEAGDSGYNSLNMRVSWKGAKEPVRWDSPQAVFDRLVANANLSTAEVEAEKRRELRKSVLDFVMNDDLPRLRNQLGAADKEKLDSYLSGLRDVERQVDAAFTGATSCNIVDGGNANGNMTEQITLMFDLMINAFQCDLTRVGVIGLGRDGNDFKPNGLGLANGWHTTSHYTSDAKQADYIKLGLWVAELGATLMDKLNAANLMQNSLISFGAGTGGDFTQAHGDDNLPTLLMGHANGAVETGRHLKLSDTTPIANLWAAMAHHAGAPVPNDRWGEYGTGRLDLT